MIPFESTYKKSILGIVFALLLVGIFIFIRYSSAPRGLVIIPPPTGPIRIEGTIVCLPHKNTSGPQTMECAYGLLDNQQRYFALRDSDSSFNTISGVPTNSNVTVIGNFSPAVDKTYVSIGTIIVTDISQENGPQRITVEGVYDCLPHKDTTVAQTDECAYGIYTTENKYYALDFGSSSQTISELQSGDRIFLTGVFTPLVVLSTNYWNKYPIEGIISVTDSLKKL